MPRLQASLLAGLFIGIVSALPLVGAANVCCCLWVVVGGLLVTYLRQQGRSTAIESADAALSGLAAGAIGALINLVFSLLMFTMAGDIAAQVRSMAEQFPQLPPDVRDRLMTFDAGAGFVLLMSLVTVPVYAIFGMLGALLGLVVFKKPATPATPA
jgi:hypothetical protein